MMNGRMSRREFIALAGMGAAAMSVPVPGLFAADRRKPNVIVILSDDHGYGAIGCQGCRDIPTPNIDSIAKKGVRCTNGYVTCPVCSPTRAGLNTGRYQQCFGHEDNPGPPNVCAPNFGLPLDEKTTADYMKAQGYATGMVGKWHLGHKPECNPTKRGFDEFFGFLTGAHSYTNPGVGTAEPILRGTEEVDEKEYLTDAFGREAISFIDRHKEKPFFLYLAFNAVHAPLQAAKRYEDEFTQFKNPDKRKYAAMLTAMDEQIGRVLAKVREAGLEKDTLIFFLGDNGGYRLAGFAPNAPLSGFKGDTFEGGVRIPFIVQWKGKLPAGKTYDKPVISLDVLPTAVTVAGGKPGANVDGVNILPFLKGEKKGVPHDRLFWRWIDKYGARVGDWKLVQNGDGKELLFNLADDIGETTDLSAANPDKLKQLKAAYKDWDTKNIPPKWLDGRRKLKAQ
ncbi:MAG: sulfatase-like hydrolase/transferase [Armatimonadetes bacterium]|nr:sulfatase-like hydrolase/transferase [Armatimonadota bacterium]